MQKENNYPIFLKPVSADGNRLPVPGVNTSRPAVERVRISECADDLSFSCADTDRLLGQRKRQWVWIDGIRPRWI